MQDKHNFKQLGTIYESMVTGGRDPQGGYSPEPGSEGFKRNELSVKLPIPSRRGRQPAGPMTTLRYNPTALEPFLSKQNDSINDFLAALGVPEPEKVEGPPGGFLPPYQPSPVELLQPSEIEYLVTMLNKKFGTTFSYDDYNLLLVDAGPNEEHDDEDAEDSAASRSGRKAGYQFGRSAAGAKKGKRTPPVMPGPKPGEREPLDWRADGGGAEPRMRG